MTVVDLHRTSVRFAIVMATCQCIYIISAAVRSVSSFPCFIIYLLLLLLTIMPSTRCSGCSKSFQYPPSNTRCGRCVDRAAGCSNNWPQCTGCGSMYEFLDAGALCGACEEHCESCSKLKSPSAVLTSLLVVDVAPAVQKALEHPQILVETPSQHP
jgi:hypothetical protein